MSAEIPYILADTILMDQVFQILWDLYLMVFCKKLYHMMTVEEVEPTYGIIYSFRVMLSSNFDNNASHTG